MRGLGLGTVLMLLLTVACGASATATPVSTKAPPPPSATVSPTVPIVASTSVLSPTPTARPAATSTTGAPTPTQAVAPIVNPGKITWMTSGWGNGRFTFNYSLSAGNNYGRLLHGFLVASDEKRGLIPGIASKWEISKDGKTWTFTIRDGAKFHDGKPITAEDAWWTLMHYWGKDESGSAVERATQGGTQALARNTDKIELTGRDQVSITTKAADASLVGATISEASPIWYGVLPKRPKVHDNAQEAAYEKNPIGAGPMKLARNVTSDLIAFERFDDFYYQPSNGLPEDRRVKFKSLDLRLVPEEATRVAAVRAGEVDIAPVSLAATKQVEAGGGHIVFGPEGIAIVASSLGCWKTPFPCSDKRVRQALAYAIDKDLMRDKLFGGPNVFQVKGWIYVTPSTAGYSPELDPFPFDLAKARQLLSEAGYPDGKGFGKLIINTYVSVGIPFLPESAQLVADFWKKGLGLDVEVKVGDEPSLRKQLLSEELYGQILWADNPTRLEADVRSTYGIPGSSGRLHENQELFALMDRTLAVIDPSARALALNNLYRRLRDEQYQLGIGYANIPWAVGPRVTSWQPWPLAGYPSNLNSITLK